MAFTTIAASEVDAKSPIDDTLMGTIKADLDDLNSRVIVAGASPYAFELHGKLEYIAAWKRSLCAAVINAEFTPSQARFVLKKGGTSGTLAFDIRKHTTPKTPITAIAHQYSDSTSSIGRVGTGLTTQSIARVTTQVGTQSITHAKAAVNIQSIIGLGTVADLGSNLWQYNLASALDSDTLVGDSILFSGATSGANNGTFTIVEKGRGGGANVVVTNASGVAQTSAAGTAQVKIMSYNLINPANTTGFQAGYASLFAAHSSAANDGTLTVYAVNSGGNNIWVKNSAGVVQGGVAGTIDTLIWTFALSAAALTTDYSAGEKAHTTTHGSGGNNGDLSIVAVNSGGNNLLLYNTAGVVQAGAGGLIESNRWKYVMPSNPTADVSTGYTIYASGHSNANNNGDFTVVGVNNAGGNNIVVYNLAGVAQGGAAGTVSTTRKKVSFASDQSANYTTASFVEMTGTTDRLYDYADFFAPLQVVEVNRGGGANYNIVVDMPSGRTSASAVVSPAGYVQIEMKSIFTSAPSLAVDLTGLEANQDLVGVSTSISATAIPAQTPLMLYLTSVPSGHPEHFSVYLR